MKRARFWIGWMLAYLLIGCAGTEMAAPVEERRQPPSRDLRLHVVDREETLYSIAFRYETSVTELARINAIGSPYLIYPGQRLYLTAEAAQQAGLVRQPATSTTVNSPPAAGATPVVVPSSVPTRTVSESNRVAQVVLPDRIGQWAWPLVGPVTRAFGGSEPASKGISISATQGADVVAAAPGVVVYSGAGLRGYGNLLIVKHSDVFLTAYAHNADLLVREGDQVHLGQTIARVGRSPDGRPGLYFEIRENGKPVDPIRFLPRR